MPKLNVQQNNQNVIQAFRNALAIGNLKGIIASDGSHNFSTAGSNRNLLDNPWFTVNQRGNSSYSYAGYSVDRWLSNGTQQVTVSSDGVTLGEQGYRFVQRMENPAIFAGKTVTISAKTNATNVRFAYWDSTSDYSNGSAITVPVVDGYASLTINITNGIYAIGLSTASGTGGLYRAMKLELGSVSTLANDVPPKESQATDDCKWYFQRIQQEDGYTAPVGFGMVSASTTILRTLIPLSSPLRKAGTLTATATNIGQMRVQGNGSNLTPTAITGRGVLNGHAVVDITVNGTLVTNQVYTLVFANSTAIIDLSKDL